MCLSLATNTFASRNKHVHVCLQQSMHLTPVMNMFASSKHIMNALLLYLYLYLTGTVYVQQNILLTLARAFLGTD